MNLTERPVNASAGKKIANRTKQPVEAPADETIPILDDPNPIIDWMDERFQVRNLLRGMLHVHIPRKAKTYYLGGITLFMFMVQAITGSLLSLYYQPTPDTAYDSVLFITSNVNFGWLIRSIHSWGANLMVVFCALHLLRVFFQGAYKRPREVTWGVGVLLLAVTMGFGFTGYLLPWDQRAYWATTVGSESAGAVPVIGEYLLRFMRGGLEVTDATLSRFYGVHTLILPLTLAAMLGVHLMLMHQQGLANPRKSASENSSENEKTLPFFPHYVISELIAWYIVLALLIVLASLYPVGLEERADPLVTPPHIKPEWYFLSLYQLLKWVPRTVGVLAPLFALPVLLMLPFLDRNPEVLLRKRPFAVISGLLVIAAIVGLTVWGVLS